MVGRLRHRTDHYLIQIDVLRKFHGVAHHTRYVLRCQWFNDALIRSSCCVLIAAEAVQRKFFGLHQTRRHLNYPKVVLYLF